MMLTKGAIGNLINRYSTVLKKCLSLEFSKKLLIISLMSLFMSGESNADNNTIISTPTPIKEDTTGTNYKVISGGILSIYDGITIISGLGQGFIYNFGRDYYTYFLADGGTINGVNSTIKFGECLREGGNYALLGIAGGATANFSGSNTVISGERTQDDPEARARWTKILLSYGENSNIYLNSSSTYIYGKTSLPEGATGNGFSIGVIDARNSGTITFNSETTTIIGDGTYGVNGVVASEGGNIYFNNGNILINSYVKNGVGKSNVIGFLTDESNITVSSNVNQLKIQTEGAAWNTNFDPIEGSNADGSAAICSYSSRDFNSGVTIESAKFIIDAVAGEDTEHTTFDSSKVASGKYSMTLGITAYDFGTVTVGSNTLSTINVKDYFKNSCAIYAYSSNDSYDWSGGGIVSILGETHITAKGGSGTSAIISKGGSSVTIGSDNKEIEIKVIDEKTTSLSSDNNKIIGIYSEGYDEYSDTKKCSNVSIQGNNITISATTNVSNEKTYSLYSKDKGIININGSYINITGEIISDGGNIEVTGNNISIIGDVSSKNSGEVAINGASYTGNDCKSIVSGSLNIDASSSATIYNTNIKTLTNNGTLSGDNITTKEGWTLSAGSTTTLNSLVKEHTIGEFDKVGSVGGIIYSLSGILDLGGVDLRILSTAKIYGKDNQTTLDTLKATRVFFGDIYQSGADPTVIKNIELEQYEGGYRAALGVYYGKLTVDNVSVIDEDTKWYRHPKNNYQMYTGYGAILTVNESLTTGEFMNAGTSFDGTGYLNLSDGAIVNAYDFQNRGKSRTEARIDGDNATVYASMFTNSAYTSLGTLHLNPADEEGSIASTWKSTRWGSGSDVDEAYTKINTLLVDGVYKYAFRLSDGSETYINNIDISVDKGFSFYITDSAKLTVNEDNTGTVKMNGNIIFANYSDSSTYTENTQANVTLNINGNNSYLTGQISGTYSFNAKPTSWAGNPVYGDEDTQTTNIKGMTLNLSNGATWNVTANSFVNNLTLNNSAIINTQTSTASQTILTAENFISTGNSSTFNFDISLTNATGSDQIHVKSATGTIKLGNVNIIIEDANTLITDTIVLFTGINDESFDVSDLTLDGIVTVTSDGVTYKFKQDTINKGNLVITTDPTPEPTPDPKDPEQTIETYTDPETGAVAYDVKGDTKFTEDIAETEKGSTTAMELNGHIVEGSGTKGATVTEESTMVVDGGTMTNFSTAVTTQEGGTALVSDMTFTGNGTDIQNDGTVNFAGNNTLDSISGKGEAVNTADSTLTFTSASGVGCEIKNEGTVELGKGELSSNINSESGTVKSVGEVTSTAKVVTKGFEVGGDASYGLKTGGSLEVLESTALNGTLEAKQGGSVTMAKGAELSIKDGGEVKLTGGTVTMDAKNVMSSDYKSTQGDKVVGESGLLALRLENASDAAQKTYTKEEYRQAKASLFGDSGESAKLGLIYGTVQADEGDSVVIGGDQSAGKVVIDGNTPVLAENNQTAKEADIDLIYEPNRNVRIVDENKRADEATLVAPEIEVSNTSFVVKGLEVASETESVSVTLKENATLTLTGGDDAEKSVVAKNGEQAEVPTSFIVKEGTQLDFGMAENKNDQKATITGVLVEDGGTHNVAGNGTNKTIFSYDSLEVQNDGPNEAKVSVTNAVLKVESLKATGGNIYVDPAYLEASSLSGDTFGAALLVSEGSVVNFGADVELLKEAATKAGLSPNSVSDGFTLENSQSMLAVSDHVNLGNTGKVIVDAGVQADGSGSPARSTDRVYFGDGSLLLVNGSAITEQAAISSSLSGSTASIGDTAKLYIANAQAGESYFILDVDGDIAGSAGWTGDNLLTDSDMVGATFHYVDEGGNKKGWVSVTTKDAKDVYDKLDGELVRLVNNLYENGLNDVDSGDLGARFLSRATHRAFGGDKDKATRTIESAARIGIAGAVPQMSVMASETLSDAIGNRMSVSNGYNAIQEQEFTKSFALWITPLWKNQSGFGMEACNFNYGFNANIGGIALGADYSFSENVKAGIAFNIGGGHSKSSGDLSSTENNMNFWGLGVYGGYNDGTLSVMADASYTSTYNKLEQDLDAAMMMNDLKADVRAAVVSVGVRADYKVKLDALDITPHVGVRFQNVSSLEYDIKGGGTVAKSDGIQQNIWSVPVGVTFAKDFTTSGGWSVTPSVDFTVTPRFGDLKAYESVRFTGVPGDAGLHTQTRDYITYKGTAGIGAKYDNIGLNLNYSYEGGSCTSGHGVNASFRWEF